MDTACEDAAPVLRLHRFVARTEAEGPGPRACLWVQGCPIGCPGCFNPSTWDTQGGRDVSVSELIQCIEKEPGLEGVTFVGGEPFAQAAPLAWLGEACRARGLSVVTFSGYPYAVLKRSSDPAWQALLAVTDLLLAGPYVARLQDFSRPWVGSANQEFVFLTARYASLRGSLDAIANRIEVCAEGGTLRLNGQAHPAHLAGLRDALSELGLNLL